MKVKHVEPWMREWAFEGFVRVMLNGVDEITDPGVTLTSQNDVQITDIHNMSRYQRRAIARILYLREGDA